jgi:DNA-binding NtrC family response regulator
MAPAIPYRTTRFPPRTGGVKQVLIVDDNSAVLSTLARAMALQSFSLTLAREPHEALARAGELRKLDLVITDYLMPSMTGEELIGHVRERHPGVKALIMSGHGDLLDREAPEWWTREAHLTKPYKLSTLRCVIAELIGTP